MPKVTEKKIERQARRYGKKESFVIPVWNGILEHAQAIGPALWEFLWCLDKITFEDENNIGWCLGKTPIDSKDIARELDEHPQTAYTNLKRLVTEGYLVRVRTPRGYCIGVRNSAKFSARRQSKPAESDSQNTINHNTQTDSQKTINHSEVNDRKRYSDLQKTITARDVAVDFAVKETLHNPSEPITGEATIALPNWIPTREWFVFLNQLRTKPTIQRQELFVKKLTELRDDGHDPTAILEQSIQNNWQGLFPLRNATKKPNPNDRTRNNMRAVGLCEHCFQIPARCQCNPHTKPN